MMTMENPFGPNTPVQQSGGVTLAELDAYLKKNNFFQPVPVQGVDPAQFINPRYTRAPMDNSLAPLAMFQQFKQSGVMPQAQNTFTPWKQPATPMIPVGHDAKGPFGRSGVGTAPFALGNSGGK